MRIFAQAAVLILAALILGCSGDRNGEIPASSKLSRFETDYFTSLYSFHPTLGSRDGLHQHDGPLDEITTLTVGRRIDELKRMMLRLRTLRTEELSPAEAIDAELIDFRIRSELLELEHIERWRNNPLVYVNLPYASINRLMHRQYPPASDRLRAVITSLHEVSAVTAAMRGNVTESAPLFTELALQASERALHMLRNELPEWAQQAAGVDLGLLMNFRAAALGAERTLEVSIQWLNNDLLPVSRGDYALGAERFMMKLLFEEMLEVPIYDLVAIGEANLERDRREFAEVANRIAPNQAPAAVMRSVASNHPSADTLVAATERVVEKLRQAITSEAISAIPSDDRVVIVETPVSLRNGFFALRMDPPGAAEAASREGICYVTPPQASWGASRQAEHLRRFNPYDMHLAIIHEVYPGRYLQSLYAQEAPTHARRMLACRSNADGWGQYVEQMMLDEGYIAEDPKVRLAQLRKNLAAYCRLLASIKVHTEGMPVEEATWMFIEKAYQEPSVAYEEALRAVVDPAYFVGTLGKMQILKLREDYRKAKGDNYSLRNFHDNFIKQGTIPIKLVRKALLPGDKGPAL